jgi:hypothetical protein
MTFIRRLFLMAPEIAPRTELGFQPVASTRSAIVAPSGRRNIAMMVSSLLGLADAAVTLPPPPTAARETGFVRSQPAASFDLDFDIF